MKVQTKKRRQALLHIISFVFVALFAVSSQARFVFPVGACKQDAIPSEVEGFSPRAVVHKKIRQYVAEHSTGETIIVNTPNALVWQWEDEARSNLEITLSKGNKLVILFDEPISNKLSIPDYLMKHVVSVISTPDSYEDSVGDGGMKVNLDVQGWKGRTSISEKAGKAIFAASAKVLRIYVTGFSAKIYAERQDELCAMPLCLFEKCFVYSEKNVPITYDIRLNIESVITREVVSPPPIM